jgi:hypothetical protein
VTVESPPFATQGGSFGAEQTRRAIGTLLARGSSVGSVVGGLVGAADMAVTAGSGMQVLVAPGEAWIPGTSVSTQSGYYGRVTSSTALAISASNGSNPRIETIIAQVKDKAYAGTEETFTVSVIPGTAEAGATLGNKKGAGAVPASSLVLAYVLVPTSSSSISAGNIELILGTVLARQLPVVVRSGSFTAASGESILIFPTSATVILPPLASNAVVEIWNFGNGNVTITSQTANVIQGDFITDATSIVLTIRQHVRLQSDSSKWYIIAGEPLREAKYAAKKAYTKAEAETGFTPSATRPAMVNFSATPGTLTIGGVEVTNNESGWYVPPGQAVKWTEARSVSMLLL